MSRIFRQLRRRIVYIPLILLVVGGGLAYAFLGGEEAPVFTTVSAERGTIREEVSVVGRIRSTERLELGLESGGKVARVTVKEGDRVSRGQVLVSLTSDDLGAQLRSAQAGVERELAGLDRLLGGTSDADRAVTAANVESSETARDNAEESLEVQLNESYVTLDSSLGTNVDRLFEDPRSASPGFGTSIYSGSTRFLIGANQADKSRLNRGQAEAVRLLGIWRDAIASGDRDDTLDAAEDAVSHLQLYLSDLAGVINRLEPESTADQAIYDNFKSGVASARSATNAAASAISAAKQQLASAEAALRVTQSQSDFRDQSESADVRMQRAALASAEAQVSLVSAQIAKNTVVSPVDGVAATVTAKVGEIASGVVVSVIADAPLEIEAQVAEADIAKIAVDNTARVTLDAYSGETFQARVIYVAPAEVEIEGVPTYKVRLQLENEDDRLKPGMTADLDVATKTRENVIAIPQRGVITRDGQKVVRIADGDVSREVVVKTGIRGTDGRIEITEGLQEGAQVIVGSNE